MIKNLTPREKSVLARILMPYIMRSLDNNDFGLPRTEDPRLNYVKPHLSLSGSVLLDTYLAKLSPNRRNWIDTYAEAIIVAGTADLRPSETQYYLDLAHAIKQNNGGELITYGRH